MIAPKRISSGKYIDLLNFKEDDVTLEDINTALNYIYRFSGHHKDAEPLTVAQHTKLVVQLAQELFPNEIDVHFDCLLHDLPEAYYGDVPSPIKKILGTALQDFTKDIDKAVYDKLWKIELPFTEEVYHKRKICDLLSLDIERRTMWDSQIGKDHWPEIPNDKFYSLKEKREIFEQIQSERFVNLIEMYNGYVS